MEDEGPDDTDQILGLLENGEYERDDDDTQDITLPPIDADSIDMGTRTFRSDTGIGIDWLPPRLVSRMTRGAKQRLAEILASIERAKRWPSAVRAVVEIARAKKNGGARLIGLAPSIYRIWSRVRYLQTHTHDFGTPNRETFPGRRPRSRSTTRRTRGRLEVRARCSSWRACGGNDGGHEARLRADQRGRGYTRSTSTWTTNGNCHAGC